MDEFHKPKDSPTEIALRRIATAVESIARSQEEIVILLQRSPIPKSATLTLFRGEVSHAADRTS